MNAKSLTLVINIASTPLEASIVDVIQDISWKAENA